MLLVSSVGVLQFNSILHYQGRASDPTGKSSVQQACPASPPTSHASIKSCASDQSEALGIPSLCLVNLLEQLTDPRKNVSSLFTSVL